MSYGHGSKYCFGTPSNQRASNDARREKLEAAPKPESVVGKVEHQPITGETESNAIA